MRDRRDEAGWIAFQVVRPTVGGSAQGPCGGAISSFRQWLEGAPTARQRREAQTGAARGSNNSSERLEALLNEAATDEALCGSPGQGSSATKRGKGIADRHICDGGDAHQPVVTWWAGPSLPNSRLGGSLTHNSGSTSLQAD